jgi:hypothetical protein
MVGIDHDDRVVGDPAGFEMTQRATDFIIEMCDAAVIKIDDLIKIEFFLRRALDGMIANGSVNLASRTSTHRHTLCPVSACTTATRMRRVDAWWNRRHSEERSAPAANREVIGANDVRSAS